MNGKDGATGATGAKGTTGAEGAKGAAGETGHTGLAGPRGLAGPQGEMGELNEHEGRPRAYGTVLDRQLKRLTPDLIRLRRIVFINTFMWLILGTAGIVTINNVSNNARAVSLGNCAVADYATKQASNIRKANDSTSEARSQELEQLSKNVRAEVISCPPPPKPKVLGLEP